MILVDGFLVSILSMFTSTLHLYRWFSLNLCDMENTGNFPAANNSGVIIAHRDVRYSGTHKLYIDGKTKFYGCTSMNYDTDNCVYSA